MGCPLYVREMRLMVRHILSFWGIRGSDSPNKGSLPSNFRTCCDCSKEFFPVTKLVMI